MMFLKAILKGIQGVFIVSCIKGLLIYQKSIVRFLYGLFSSISIVIQPVILITHVYSHSSLFSYLPSDLPAFIFSTVTTRSKHFLR